MMVKKKAKEDYLKAIYERTLTEDRARTNGIAKDLDIAPASVTEMFRKLSSEGLVDYKRYEGATLTDKGMNAARSIRDINDTITTCLKLLQVPTEKARNDACKVEHCLAPKTMEQIKKFVQFFEECPRENPTWVDHFRQYCETGKHPEVCEDSRTN